MKTKRPRARNPGTYRCKIEAEAAFQVRVPRETVLRFYPLILSSSLAQFVFAVALKKNVWPKAS